MCFITSWLAFSDRNSRKTFSALLIFIPPFDGTKSIRCDASFHRAWGCCTEIFSHPHHLRSEGFVEKIRRWIHGFVTKVYKWKSPAESEELWRSGKSFWLELSWKSCQPKKLSWNTIGPWTPSNYYSFSLILFTNSPKSSLISRVGPSNPTRSVASQNLM